MTAAVQELKAAPAAQVLERIEADGKARAKPDPVVYRSLKPGAIHWQGDVGIRRIPKRPAGAQPAKEGRFADGQLAEGATRGSRHIVKAEHLKHCRFYEVPGADALTGPVLEAKKPVEVTHPDHGHVTLPAGCYSIHYQRQLANELKRVAD